MADEGRVVTDGPWLCRAFGESDRPMACIAKSRADVERFFIDEWMGDKESPELPEAMARFDEHDFDDETALEWEFEIGGVSVERIFESVSRSAAPAEVAQPGGGAQERRYIWAVNELLACDYGDNESGGVGWRVYGWNSRNGERRIYGASMAEAIDYFLADNPKVAASIDRTIAETRKSDNAKIVTCKECHVAIYDDAAKTGYCTDHRTFVAPQVQACRPEDRAMLASAAGQELVRAAINEMSEKPAARSDAGLAQRLIWHAEAFEQGPDPLIYSDHIRECRPSFKDFQMNDSHLTDEMMEAGVEAFMDAHKHHATPYGIVTAIWESMLAKSDLRPVDADDAEFGMNAAPDWKKDAIAKLKDRPGETPFVQELQRRVSVYEDTRKGCALAVLAYSPTVGGISCTKCGAYAGHGEALVCRWETISFAISQIGGLVERFEEDNRILTKKLEAAELLAATATQRAQGMEADARRYRGVRSLKYKMYVADARSLGPQMEWQSEEAFNATYDSRHDAAIDAALSAAAESGE